ncbi:hypothetical protein [Aquisphaera insulae]|uniref:hypothetical protein n=1 Tax=Aquisphaera insulae TaxID=2712864 RepID=UPI0013EB5248|nr:hypothetical protein [Aquisphaera insulae]
MIIESDYLTEGLFGQIFIWMLEVLPYIESRGWKPEWRIRSRNYGDPETANIFPGIIRTNYDPEPGGEIQSFEKLNFFHKHQFRHNYRAANRLWNTYFRFTDDIYERLYAFQRENLEGETVLGIHYRGTDKNVDRFQTNPTSRYQFLCIVEDFLRVHPDVTSVFVASDDTRFIEAMCGFPRVRFYQQARSQDGRPLWNDQKCTDKQALAKDAILDSLTLSHCRYVLKSMSQLSAFVKIFNPDVEAYRGSACKPDWFPEAYVPLYRSEDRAVKGLLRVLQRGDARAPIHTKAIEAPERIGRLASQVWKRRGTLASRTRLALFGK